MTTASTHIYELPIPMPSTTTVAEFAELYERHYEAVFRAALRITGNRSDAEDVLQTVFVRIITRGADREDLALPNAYFRRAAVNAAVDVLRRREMRAESDYDSEATHAAVQSPVLLKEQLRRALAALERGKRDRRIRSRCGAGAKLRPATRAVSIRVRRARAS